MTRAGWALVGLSVVSLGSIHEKLWPGDLGPIIQGLGLVLVAWALIK